MKTKLFEIRDSATFIPAFAFRPADALQVRPTEKAETIVADAYLVSRSGYGTDPDCVIFGRLELPSETRLDPYDWGTTTRTMAVAHKFVAENWDRLESGAVIDVEHILGERPEPKVSERITHP